MRLIHGDCVEVMAGMEAESVDAVVTDPPYALTSQIATVRSAFPGRYNGTEGERRGFMGQTWDGTLPGVETWREALRVLKPGGLMRWLVRLVTPRGGLVLDPFAGSGTTLIACRLEGFRAVGIEREAEYVAMAAERYRRRWDPAAAQWNGRKDEGLAQLGLFGGAVPVEEVEGDG